MAASLAPSTKRRRHETDLVPIELVIVMTAEATQIKVMAVTQSPTRRLKVAKG